MIEQIPISAVANVFNEYSSAVDSKGLYTVVQYKRLDGSLYMKSTLSNPDPNGYYQTMTWEFYDGAGTTLLYSQVWTLTNDAQGVPISKVVSA